MKVKAAIIEEKGQDFKIAEIELDEPKENEVLVKVCACGVCHTDDVARRGLFELDFPAVLGHEGAGIIVKTGPNVTGFSEGDHVGFSFGYCGECKNCKEGAVYGCSENRKLNFSGVQADGTKRRHYNGKEVSAFFGQGAYAEYAVVNKNNLFKVKNELPLGLAAPLGCGIQTGAGTIFNYLHPNADSSIMITGCGAVGLSSVMAAKIAGCSVIIACDIVEDRLSLAMEMGATHTINSLKVKDVVEEVRNITGGAGADYAVDCTGNGKCVRTSLQSTRSLGICAVVGATQELEINVENDLVGPARTLRGIVEGLCIPQLFIPKLLNYYEQGRFPFDKMIKYYRLEEINKAFEDTKSGKVIKAVLLMD